MAQRVHRQSPGMSITPDFTLWRPVQYSEENIVSLIGGITSLQELCYPHDCTFSVEDPRLIYLEPADFQRIRSGAPNKGRNLSNTFRAVADYYRTDPAYPPPTGITTVWADEHKLTDEHGGMTLRMDVEPETLIDYQDIIGSLNEYLKPAAPVRLKRPHMIIGHIGSMSMEHSAPGAIHAAVREISLGQISTGPLEYSMLVS